MKNFISKNLYSPSSGINSAGENIKKAYLNYVDEDLSECDCCDEQKQCCSITSLGNDVLHICRDCLQLIINEF